MKNKKALIAIFALFACALAIGVTYATLSSSHTYSSQLQPDYFRIETSQTFTSPSNWSTCQTVANPIVITNSSSVPATVRVRYDEYWRVNGSASTGTTTDLPLIDGDNNRVAVINFASGNAWVYNNGWYEYQQTLAPNQATTPLVESVTLNCDANLGGTNVCSTTGNRINCTRAASSYADAQYHLKFTIETTQSLI